MTVWPVRPRRRAVGFFLALLVSVVAVGRRARSAFRRTRDVPLSPLVASTRVGSDYLQRNDVTTGVQLSGEMDDMAAFARPDFDPDEVHPEVRRFYECTADYDMAYRVHWHRGFRVGAALAARLTSRIEQLNLPGPWQSSGGPLTSELVAIDPDEDPRDGARAWIRTDGTGTAVFVAIYASHVRDGIRYVNIAVPLPWSNLSTVLHVRTLDGSVGDEDGEGTGIELTTRSETGDEGLYLRTPLGPVALPMEQRFRVAPEGDGIHAEHAMWVFGRRFLTIEYDANR
ncbi:hypothetical protein BG842_01855 [Haladaptatus sp. W1]|uniref:hypothetical protein n=1 Tax=Haladaptatus sp. W1 TaxID=1897478 RepID=UPI000849D078|nr:hypothetical protein [Haladaptatus sp. W1]ODR81076.1 hypothetical protein BG842_01855 [Haladaptatus sp. W1]